MRAPLQPPHIGACRRKSEGVAAVDCVKAVVEVPKLLLMSIACCCLRPGLRNHKPLLSGLVSFLISFLFTTLQLCSLSRLAVMLLCAPWFVLLSLINRRASDFLYQQWSSGSHHICLSIDSCLSNVGLFDACQPGHKLVSYLNEWCEVLEATG